MVWPAILYLLVILFLIYRTNFFGFFKDPDLSSQTLTSLFFVKSLAIPVFCLVYKKMYGGIEHFDAGIFFSDAKALNTLAYLNFKEYLKAMLALQDESPGSYFYDHVVIYTHNWDNGKLRDFFYNDNRIVIRLHSVIHFLSFGSYAVHALFNCFLSFTGFFYLYRCFKEFFKGKEQPLMLLLCLFPALWFYTGALLKEGLVIFVMGAAIFQLKKLAENRLQVKGFVWLCVLLFLSLLLKPYLLCFSAICFFIFFVLHVRFTTIHRTIYFL